MNSLRLALKDPYGNIRTLSTSAAVDAAQPTNNDTVLWIDLTNNPPILKYLEGSEYKPLLNIGVAQLSNLSSIPANKNFCTIELTNTSDTSLSIDGNMLPGQELHLIVHNGTTSKKTLTIPNGNQYVNLSEATIDLEVDKYAEINLISNGTKIFIRSI